MDPAQQQIEVSGRSVTVRPMRSSDAAMENEFVRNLSPLTRHYRFLGAVKELSPAVLKSFCDVDGHLSMAFVATVPEDGHEVQVGVSRYAPNAVNDVREIAVTVADDWKHKGLDTRLARILIEHAREHGVKRIYSVDLADNDAMRHLAANLGMVVEPDPEDRHQVIYSMSITDDRPVAE